MKQHDIQIITHLRKDGRMALTDLSRKTQLPVSTLHERLKAHVKNKLLTPSALIDFEKIGFTTRAHILIAVDGEKEKLYTHLQQHQNVNSLYRINNGWNILMECVFKNMHELEDFVEKLQNNYPIKRKEVHYILDELKRERFLSQPELAQSLLG